MINHVLALDYETFYSKEYSLRRMSVPEYILHPQFKVHLLAAYDLEWASPRIIDTDDIPAFLAQYPAEETLAIAHNALFDHAISSWKYTWVPKRMADTLGMARALRSYEKYSLGQVADKLLGYNPKGDVLGRVIGMNVQDIKNAGLWGSYRTYAMQDVKTCFQIYAKLLPEFPTEEQKIMDLVLRAAVVPTLRADVYLLQTHLDVLRKRKAALLRDCGYEKAALMSTAQFQDALEQLGVDVICKESPTGRRIPAFAKTDQFMQELLEYDSSDDEDVNLQVQALAMARLSFKSTLEETRAERFLNVAKLPWGNGSSHLLPVALRYGAAHTHRLGGEWKMNLQNLPRDKTKSKLRHALIAPAHNVLMTADLSQIEARIVACLCKEDGLIEAFRKGEDVYASFASVVFGRNINKKADPNERFIGKTAILGLGYGCGHEKFYKMVLAQARTYKIPLDGLFDKQLAETIVYTYRRLFSRIPAAWRALDGHLARVINSHNQTQRVPWGPVTFKSGTVLLPNSMTLRYQIGDKDIYGAKFLENITQALARIVIMQAALRLANRGYRFVLQSHDELVFVVPVEDVEMAGGVIMREMLKPPKWMPELPLAAEIGVGINYGETK